MRNWYNRLASKPILSLAALATIAFLIAEPRPAATSANDMTADTLRQLLARPADSDPYTVHDGKVVTDPLAAVTGQPETGMLNGVTLAGNVDTLDTAKAFFHAEQMAGKAKGKVFKSAIDPHWFADNTRFWYRNDTNGGTSDFVLVDAVKGSREPAFDHDKLAASLSRAADANYKGDRLPFKTIEFVDSKAVRFTVGDTNWQCDLTSYECKRVSTAPRVDDPPPFPAQEPLDFSQNSYEPDPADQLSPEEMEQVKGQQKKGQGKGGMGGPGKGPGARELKSPDGKWTAFVKEFNVWLRDGEGVETQITQSGKEGDAFSAVTWSPNSLTVVAYCSTPGDNKTVYLIDTSPKDQLPAKLSERPYPRPGDKFPTHEVWLVDVRGKKALKADVERIDFRGIPNLRWSKDGSRFTFEKTDRGHQRFRVVEVDAFSGKTRNLIDEKSETSMVNHYSDGAKNDTFYLKYYDDTSEMLYLSEMDGWKHLYLIDAKEGKVKYQITKGEWVVRKINKVDVEKRQIWFQASGKIPGQDPYLVHHYRVNFDGSGLVALTDGDGNHSIVYSPDGRYVIDTYSRVDMAPVHELRRVDDGKKICDLEKADVSALQATGWRYPEVFSAKGRDGKTDIWGIVFRPQKYDPSKKYPVIEYIYAGPHSSHVPKTFAETRAQAALAELGFIVVQIDGMGTMNRSRAFHAVCWKNLSDAGFPDRILWMKALAQKYAYVDTTRVGIYGTSAGGQNAMGALLFHPEFYKVAVAACGCHDNRLDKSSWNESWMGLMGPHYEANSNVTNAHKLQGRLLLIVGELDTNVPPESTYRCVDALIKARKDFDLIVVPGMGHSSGGPHGERRKNEFFQQYLLGVLPVNHNAQ